MLHIHGVNVIDHHNPGLLVSLVVGMLNILYVYDILSPTGYLSDIENLVWFARALFEDNSFKYRIKHSYYLCQYHHFEIHA